MQHLKFIHKLHSILSRPELQEWIFWSKQDSSVFIVKPYDPKFSSQVLKRYFKHGNVSSFVRQLHMYGFHKISSNHSKDNLPIVDKTDIKWSFTHPSGYFHKDAYPLTLNNIQRKRTGLGKDGKRKNILSPVSVSFINAAGTDVRGLPMVGGIQQGTQNMANYMMAAQQQPTMETMMPQQHMMTMGNQPVMMSPQVMNGYVSGNEVPDGSVYMTDPLGRLQKVENGTPMLGNMVPSSESQENIAMNFRRQSVPRYSMAPNPQLAQYPTTTMVETPNGYRPYYPESSASNSEGQQTGNLPRSINSLPVRQPQNVPAGQPALQAYGYPKPGSPHSRGATLPIPSIKANIHNDISEVDSCSSLSTIKRQSIAISDINNNSKRDSITTTSSLPLQLHKPMPPISISVINNERPSSGGLLHSSSNETLGSVATATNGPLSEMRESKILQQAYEEKIKYIDTNIDMLMANIANIERLARGLKDEKDAKFDNGTATKSEGDERSQKSPEFPKVSLRDGSSGPRHLDKISNFLDDIKSVMEKYSEITI